MLFMVDPSIAKLTAAIAMIVGEDIVPPMVEENDAQFRVVIVHAVEQDSAPCTSG